MTIEKLAEEVELELDKTYKDVEQRRAYVSMVLRGTRDEALIEAALSFEQLLVNYRLSHSENQPVWDACLQLEQEVQVHIQEMRAASDAR